MIKANAGLMRGFRIVPDPHGILLAPFESNGTKFGYVLTYGEGSPAIHDGNDWISVLTDEIPDYEQKLPEYATMQMMKIASSVSLDPVYADLAVRMNIVMPGVVPAPPSEPVVYK